MTEAFERIFKEADADKDKYLNKAEYLDFCEKMKAFQEEKELPEVTQSRKYHKKLWKAMNQLSSEYVGVSREDIGLTRNYMQHYMV